MMKITPNKVSLGKQLFLVFGATALLMICFETVKTLLFGSRLTLWQSHLMTIFVTALIGAAVFVVLKMYTAKYEDINKELAELLKFNESILFNSPLPMAVYAPNGRCVEVNEAYAHIFTLTRASMLQYHNNSVFEACGLLEKFTAVLIEGVGQRCEIHDTNLFGREVWFDCEILPMQINGKNHVLVQFYDFTQRKRAEEKLVAINNELQAAMRRLVQAEKMAALGTLVAGVAHELNTPIGNALMAASTLNVHVQELSASVNTGTLKRSALVTYVENTIDEASLIERNIIRAADLVRNFKQVAVDQASERRRHFDLQRVITDIISTMRPTLSKSSHVLKVYIEENIQLDSYPGSIEQIVTSFINNALVHAFAHKESGNMLLHARRDNEYVLLEFSDDGEGMCDEVAMHAFDPFFTTRMGVGGSGLGLYIVNNIVTDILGGNIMLTTSPGHGAHFQLRLPLVAPERSTARLE
ncbi:PAS domain-containing sensor histidine kinase [Solimicrobium silvestre]|uniref:histidine kinase n=1 Tax=Solimicrobium silvestre TaxID=2099400 RepID=A0A2S9GVN0_9BURK|nr:PAS domain-containing sensor histidine kinase [Solimicrobium silvestre]PRC91774.1 PAS domain S-box protein [Solimicrobium silvestre]